MTAWSANKAQNQFERFFLLYDQTQDSSFQPLREIEIFMPSFLFGKSMYFNIVSRLAFKGNSSTTEFFFFI